MKFSDIKPPRYESYRKPKAADEQFMTEIVSAMSRMSWTQLQIILHAGVTSGERPVGLVTRNWTEAFMFAQHAVNLAFGVETKDGTYRMTDREETLSEWPVKDRKRPSKEARMLNDKKSRDEDDDDDDKDEEGEEPEDDDDSDGDSDDDDSDDDEDDKPSKKKKSKSKKNDDDEDDGDDEDEDDKPSKKSSKDDDDDDEDEKPKKKGKGDDVKKDKKGKKDKKAKKAKKERPEKVEITDKSTVSKIGKRDKGGKKTKLLDLIPKSGIKVKELLAEAKEAGISAAKVKPWLKGFVRYEYIKVS